MADSNILFLKKPSMAEQACPIITSLRRDKSVEEIPFAGNEYPFFLSLRGPVLHLSDD